MLQTSDNIEASTMNYVFEMFGKSVTQMLTASIQQQTAIDELRSQIRSCQTQISNISGTLEEFEDRMFVRLQEMRPVIYTRDGLPLDDALEMLQNKVNSNTEKAQTQEEFINRLDAEVKTKLDTEAFESAFKAANDTTESFTDVAMSLQSLQKDLQKQRQDTDAMMERVTQMVKLQLETHNTRSQMEEDDDEDQDGYVRKSDFKKALAGLKKLGGSGGPDFDALFDENDLEGTLERLKKAGEGLDQDYAEKKAKLESNLNRAIGMLSTGDESYDDDWDYDDFEIESEFDVDIDLDAEVEFRDVMADLDGSIVAEDPYKSNAHSSGQRRNIGLMCDMEAYEAGLEEEDGGEPKSKRKKSKKQKLKEEMMKQKDKIKGEEKSTGKGKVDEQKITSMVSSVVMSKVEAMLVDLFSSGAGGIKLDKSDAKQLVTQLSSLASVKEEITKLKMLVSMKIDKIECEKELQVRITRDEFFNMLITLFPSNTAIQKALQNYKKKLPPLKKPNTPNERTSNGRAQTRNEERDEETGHYTVHQRNVKTATSPQNLVPARNSRLLALNQKFLKGADGKYYLRDVGGDPGLVMPSIVGSQTQKVAINPESAFDFQPFQPASPNKQSEVEKIQVPANHRAKTPPDPQD